MNEKSNLKFLSSIKGILCITVLLHHLWLLFEAERDGFIMANNTSVLVEKISYFWQAIGRTSVFGFFIITGIGIRMSFERTKKVSPRSILMRYVKLMYPILAVSMISYFLMKFKLFACYFPDTSCFSSWALGHNNFVPDLLNVIKISVFDLWKYQGMNPYVSFTWPMYCFLWGGYLCYAIASVTQGWKKSYKLFFFIMLCALFYHTDLLLFIIGFAIGDLYCEPGFVPFNHSVLNVISTVLIIMLTVLSNSSYLTDYVLREIVTGIVFLLIVFNSNFYDKCLSGRSLRFLGKISWNVYLLQYPIMFTFSCAVFQHIYNLRGMAVAEVLAVIFTIAAVILLSTLFTWFTDYINKRIAPHFDAG
ncbi:MAG: acyltransferase family protein [Eubacteriales bacterium]|nr:acyltransferase family protein [Eubacteriales bacterium]